MAGRGPARRDAGVVLVLRDAGRMGYRQRCRQLARVWRSRIPAPVAEPGARHHPIDREGRSVLRRRRRPHCRPAIRRRFRPPGGWGNGRGQPRPDIQSTSVVTSTRKFSAAPGWLGSRGRSFTPTSPGGRAGCGRSAPPYPTGRWFQRRHCSTGTRRRLTVAGHRRCGQPSRFPLRHGGNGEGWQVGGRTRCPQ